MLTKYKNCSDFWKQKLKWITRPDYDQASHPLVLCVTILKSTPSLNFLSDGLISLFILGLEMNRVLILCSKFPLNHLRLSLTRETDTKLNGAKSWATQKTLILEFKNWPKHQFCQIANCYMAILSKQVMYPKVTSSNTSHL